MLTKFLPNIYAQSVFAINYKKLKNRGIKCLLFDLDNTLCAVTETVPNQKAKELIEELKDMDFKVIIMSNSGIKRLTPFKELLCVDDCTSSKKPLNKKYLKIMQLYGYKKSEIAGIGDQIVTDVFGANRVGIMSILVNPLSLIDLKKTKFNRFLERRIMNRLSKKNLFKKGEYYD